MARVQTTDGSRWQRHGLSLCLLLGACAGDRVALPAKPNVVLEYQSAKQGQVRSTLNLAPNRQHASALTVLADGGRLTEQVRFDESGRVLDGTISMAASDAKESREVALDAAIGLVEVTTHDFHIFWQVPNDLPWFWTSLLSDPNSGAVVATPLHALVVQRAAATSDALRWLDIKAYQSHSVMVDQVLIAEDDSTTVVLGDDWADLSDGVPARMHLAGPATDLVGADPQRLSATLAACDFAPSGTRGC
jgi:hypothetical protein